MKPAFLALITTLGCAMGEAQAQDFCITSMRVAGSSQMEFQWTCPANGFYAIQKSPDLVSGFVTIATVPARGGTNTYTGAIGTAPRGFYRVTQIAFDTTVTQVGDALNQTLIALGTSGRDRITQTGTGTTAYTMSATGGGGDDWIEQHGADGDDALSANVGAGNSYVDQEGGAGNNVLGATGVARGNHTFVQKGEAGNDGMSVDDSANDGGASITQEGGAGDDIIEANGSQGDDTIRIDAGSGNDPITYDQTTGHDTVTVDGGDGDDTLTINNGGLSSILLRDDTGHVLFQVGAGDTVITVKNLEHLTILDEKGGTVFHWDKP